MLALFVRYDSSLQPFVFTTHTPIHPRPQRNSTSTFRKEIEKHHIHTLQELDQAKTPNKCPRSIRPQDPIPDNRQTSSMTENDQDRSAAPFAHE